MTEKTDSNKTQRDWKETALPPKALRKINDAMPPDAKYGEVFSKIASDQAQVTGNIAFKAGQEKILTKIESESPGLWNRFKEYFETLKEGK